MSCHHQNFQCFSAVEEGSQQHHTTHLPRIPHHDMAAHHELLEGCCLCSEYQLAQTMEAADTCLLPFYHPSSHRHPHQYALRELRRPKETRSHNECHRHHHRFNKRVVLVKNSDPSCRKTILLRLSSLHSLALFLEEVSELMHYQVRKLYTQDGHKIDNVQSLLQCPGVLVCVGREPSHPSVMENLQKTFSDKLPKLSAKSCSSGHKDKRLSTKTSIVPPNQDSESRATKQSSSEKSRQDGTDSPDDVGSGPATGNSMREDDIEKLVRVNKDGSLTMEMKVRFRLQNDQTLQWSTKVRKTTGGTSEYIQGHNNPYYAQVCDVNCSESEAISADEACFTQRYKGHTEEPLCAHCCSQDHSKCKNVSRTHAATRCILTSSSSASSLTVVSRKTVVERQTMSRSSEELADDIVERETCVTQSTEAAGTVELCTIQSETCSPKSKLNNSEIAGLHDCIDVKLGVKTAQKEFVSCTAQILSDEETQNDDGKDAVSRAYHQNINPETNKTTGGQMLNTRLSTPHQSTGSTDKTLNPSGRSRKSKPSKASYCGVSPDPQVATKGEMKTQAKSQCEIERDQSSVMSVKSNKSKRSNKSKKLQNTECKEDERGSKSAMSVHSNASTKCNSDVLRDAPEQMHTGDNKEMQERPTTSVSVNSVKSSAASEQHPSEEDVEVERALGAVSSNSKASVKSKGSRRSCTAGENRVEEDLELRTPSVMSALSNVSAELKQIACEASEDESSQHSAEMEENENESEVSAQSARSEKSNGSRKSRSGVTVTKSVDISDNVNNEGKSEQRTQSTLSVISVKSVKSDMLRYNDEVEKTPDTSTVCDEGGDQQGNTGRSSCVSDKSVKSNRSVRSSQSKWVDNSEKEDANDEERGPSVMSVKSKLSVKSTFSNASAKSNPSKQSDDSPECHTEQRESAPSNMSSASAKSFKSDASSACGKCIPVDVCNDASEKTFTEGEAGRRSVSELSDKSTISTRSNRSNSSVPNPAAESTEILCGENEEVKADRATSSGSLESHSERALSTQSAKSAKSCKSTKSNASKVCSNVNSNEDKDEEEIQERALSSMSAKTIESNNSARSTRSKNSTVALQDTNSKTPNQKNDTEQVEERPPRSMSVRTAQSQDATAQTPNEGDGADETQARAQSGLSVKTVQSETCDEPGDENRSNHEEHVEIAWRDTSGRSERSIKSNVSRASKRSKVIEICSEVKLDMCGERTAEGESNKNNLRPMSSQSVDSNISVTTNTSNSETNASFEDDSKAIDEENNDHEERPPSSVSTKSIQSSVSEISIKSVERTQSALSTKSEKSCTSEKSVKSSASDVCSGRSLAEEKNAKETHARSQSALSAKASKSTCSVKSTESKKLDDSAEKSLTDEKDHVERASSNLSVRSEKSSVSNVSSVSKRKIDSEVCLEDQENKTAEEEIEERLTSPQSVVSNTSAKLGTSKCSTEFPAQDNTANPNEEYEKKTNTERAASGMSTKSVQSSVSEISVKSATGASSVKSTKSNTSEVSVKTNVSDAQSGKPPPEEVDIEDEERTHSVVSVISDKSTQSAGLHNENHTVRSLSSLSAESETSPKSNVSTASEGVPVIDGFKNSDVRTVEEREVYLASPQSDRSQSPDKESSEITDHRNNTGQSENSTPSSMSAKSVQSHVSERSSKSADRPQSAKSAKSQTSAKSVKTDISVQSGTTANIPEKEDNANETQERTYSGLSAKTTKSTITTASTKSKAKKDISGDEGHENKSPSNMSSKSAKSTISTLSQKLKAAGVPCEPSVEKGNEETPQEEEEEEIESQSMSSMSIYSVKTDISSKSNKSKSSINFEAEENITRPKSNTSTQIISETNTPEGGNDDQGIQDQPESAMSVESRKSTKSKRSRGSASPAEESAFEFDHEERPESTQTIKLNISESKDSKCLNATAAQSPNEDCNEAPAEDRAASLASNQTSLSRTSNSSSKSHTFAAEDVNKHKKTSERAPSTFSTKSAKSLSAKSTHSAKSVKSTGPKDSIVSAEVEREESVVSDRSANLTQPQTLLQTVSCEESPAMESTDRVSCSMSAVSNSSRKSSNASQTSAGKSTKSSKLKVHELHQEEVSSHPCDEYTEEKAEKTPSVTSVKSSISAKSKKSNVFDVPAEEKTTYMEERTVSPMSAKSNLSDVPAVKVEESEDRAPAVKSTKPKASARSKKKTSEIQEKKGDEKSQSSLSVHSHLSVKSKKSTRTNISTANISSKGAREVVSDASAPSLHKKDKEDTSDKESFNTNKSREKRTEETRTEVTVENAAIPQSAQKARATKQPVICHAGSSESDLSQTLSSSDIIKEICETSAPEELNVLKRIANSQMEAEDIEGSVTNKSDKSGKKSKKNKDTDDFELVTSILPNYSPTEVVNEWLKRLPEEGDIYNLEELNEDCGELKSHAEAEEVDKVDDGDKTIESEVENVKIKDEENVMNVVHSNECQTSTEATQEDNSSHQREAGSITINSSIQVMKVLLNPKLDRCNSLPEISPVYGRKLSTSAKGLLDCLVKLQLIDHNPKNANEKDKRYQELMGILQSLWLSDPLVNEHVQNTNEHRSVDDEYNHTSSSGVDVNSGSTGSGKSSDGVKSSNDLNGLQAQKKINTQWQSKREEEKQEDEDPGTNETIRSNDSPREPPETPSSSNKTSADSVSNGQKLPEEDESESQEDTSCQSPTISQKSQLAKIQSQNLDPVWVLSLLTKIENQFMTHYTNAMQEFRVRLNLEDRDQLDVIIHELKTEIQNRIQTSIDREVRRIQNRAGLPRPPKEAASGVSTMKSEERRLRRKIRLQQSMDSQAEKSDDSASGTSYSDQRNENIDEGCPCETCIKEEVTSSLALAAIVRSTAPVAVDSGFKTVLLMKTRSSACAQTAISCAHQNEKAENLMNKVSQDEENDETEDERAESESAITSTAEEKTSDDEATLEERISAEMPCRNESKEQAKEVSLEETFVTKQEADIEKTKTNWLTVKKRLLPTIWIIPLRKGMVQSVTHSENNDTAIIDKTVKEAAEEVENKNEITTERQTTISNESESEKEEAEVTAVEDDDSAAEVDVAPTECQSSEEETNDDTSSVEKNLETSNATTEEDKATVVVTSEPAFEIDEIEEQTTATDQESDTDAAGEKTGSEDDLAEDFEKEKTVENSEEEATCTSENESSDETSDSATDDNSSGKPDEITKTKEEAVENQSAVSGNDKSRKEMAKADDAPVASIVVRDSDNEEALEVGNSAAGETGAASETCAAEVLTCSSEDETDASATSIAASSEHEMEEDVAKSEEAVRNVEKLADTENINSDTVDELSEESSEESSEEATSNDDMAADDDETAASQEGESKNEEKEEAKDDDEETSAVSEEASAEDKKATMYEDDVMNSELSTEQGKNDPEDKQAGEEATTTEDEHAEVTIRTAMSQHESKQEEAAVEELANFKDKPAIAKKPDLDIISEKENEEEGTDEETTEDESGKNMSEEGETAEHKEVTSKMKKEASVETTEAEEEETTDGENQDICDKTDTLVKKDFGEDSSEAQFEEGTGDETAQESTDENESDDKVVESEKESSKNNAEDVEEEEQCDTSKSEGAEEGETSREGSDDESESKCDTTENETVDQETEKSKELEEEDNEVTKIDNEEEFGAEGNGEEVEAGREESIFKADNDVDAVSKSESDSDKIKHSCKEDDMSDECQENIANRSLDNDEENAEESEKEDEENEALNEDWSGNQGASADGGDEAEEDSDQPEEGEEINDGQQPFVINKADVSDGFNKVAKETMLMPLDGLKNERDESEDGAYADVEDSETEINSQEEVISLESKSLKNS